MADLETLPIEWDAPSEGDILPPDTVKLIQFLASKVFSDYEPDQMTQFDQRLIAWLNNVKNDFERKTLLGLLAETFFVGRHEFEALYRTLYRGPITRWVADNNALNVFQTDFSERVFELIDASWICPVTDSLRINSFLKVTNLSSFDVRPDWRSMQRFADPKKLKEHVTNNNVSQLILLEDFVGSGTQVASSVRFAAKTLPDVQILLSPLIVCPKGDQKLADLQSDYKNLTYDPVLRLPSEAMHCYDKFKNGDGNWQDDLIVAVKESTGFKNDKDAFGFKATGAKVILYTNCPNNTLPVFHARTDDWVPLFSRIERQQ